MRPPSPAASAYSQPRSGQPAALAQWILDDGQQVDVAAARDLLVQVNEPCRITPATVSPSACEQERTSAAANPNASSAEAATGATNLGERRGGTHALCAIPENSWNA
jgi:hypothetical protein